MIMKIACLMLLFAAALRAQSPIPKENVISYWNAEPSPGTGRRLDLIGSNHLYDAPESTVVAGKVGTATVFDGHGHLRTTLSTDTYASTIRSNGQDITYAGWIQVDSLQNDQIIAGRWSRWAPSREHRLWYDAAAGVLKLDWSDSANTAQKTLNGDLTITANIWYFVAYGRNHASSELWLSVTPDTAATPRSAVRLAAVPTNPMGADAELWFGYDQIARINCYGQWDEWGVYNKTLSAGELSWLFNAGAGRAYGDFSYVNEPVLEFFHNMEQEAPARGRISYYSFSTNAALSTEQAKDGSQSLKITGDWGQIQLFNNSNTDYWCPIDKCRVSMDIYVVNFVNAMLFQLDGKSNITDLDTNEGLGSVTLYTGNGERGLAMGGVRTSGYNLPLNQWVHIDFLHDRHRTAPDNAMELYADGVLLLSVRGQNPPFEPAPFVARAWHHISLGNDLAAAPTFFIDNFEVAPEPWPDTIHTAVRNIPPAVIAGRAVTVGPNPVRDRIEFSLPAGQAAESLAIYDRHGRLIVETSWHGVSTAAVPAGPAGVYFYRLRTSHGTYTGAFARIAR
jgi:hypothetical protein